LPQYDIHHMAIQQYDNHNKVSNGFHLSKVQTLLVVIAWAGLSPLPGIFMSTLYRDAAAAWRITLTFLSGQLRGTAHWEQATLVNEYVEKQNGKDQNFQDRFSDLTSAAFTLVAGIERNGKTFLPLITTTYRRKVISTDLVH
jgi:hypothetical protein